MKPNTALKLAPHVGQSIFIGTRAAKKNNKPFVRRCAAVRVGNPSAKLVYLIGASFCDVWVGESETGTSFAARETIRGQTELGSNKFKAAWRHLVDVGLFVVQPAQGRDFAGGREHASPAAGRRIGRSTDARIHAGQSLPRTPGGPIYPGPPVVPSTPDPRWSDISTLSSRRRRETNSGAGRRRQELPGEGPRPGPVWHGRGRTDARDQA